MKKIIKIFIGGCIISFVGVTGIAAQTHLAGTGLAIKKSNVSYKTSVEKNDVGVSTTYEVNKEAFAAAGKEMKAMRAKIRAMKANVKISENFKKNFTNAENVTWANTEKTIVAAYQVDGIKNNVVYQKNGSFLHSLTYFPADKAPDEVRKIIDRDYPDDDMTLAVRVFENGMTFYFVNLETKSKIKLLSVYNGETNLLNELTKSRP